MKKVKIYKPSKNVMQSGRAGRCSKWVLEYEPSCKSEIEPIMGWTSCNDTLRQVKLYFSTRADAVAFAQKNKLHYNLLPENVRKLKPRNYSDNFKYIPEGEHKRA